MPDDAQFDKRSNLQGCCPMQRPRITIRRLMTAVAVVGLLLGMAVWGWGLKQRTDYCLHQESSHLQSAKLYRSIAKSFPEMSRRRIFGAKEERPPTIVMVPRLDPHLVLMNEHTYSADALADYYADLARKYRRVAMRPWLSLEPDPPAPEYP
jgi:hypothetical protein